MTALSTTAESRSPWTFRSRRVRSTLPGPYLARQGLVTHFAYVLLGSRDATIAFLNTFNAGLNARPLDLAGVSDAGFVAVCSEVRRFANCRNGGLQ